MANQPTNQPEEQLSDIQSLAKNIQENPGMFIGSVVFILAVALIAVLFRLNNTVASKEKASEYAFAMDEESPAERSIALAAVAESDSPYSNEAMYLSGVAAFEAKDYDVAIETLSRMKSESPDFQFTPDAVSVIGLAYEAQGNYEAAIEQYESVRSTWPDSFAARIQPNNIARCYEHLEKIPEAIEAYQEQIAAFPGSNEARRAQENLNRMRVIHPDAFESEEEADGIDAADLVSDIPAITSPESQ